MTAAPEPGQLLEPVLSTGLGHGAARPAGEREVAGQLHLGQPAGEQQPAVVGDEHRPLPAGLEQLPHPQGHGLQLVLQSPGEARPLGVTVVIEGAGLGPGGAGRVAVAVGSSQVQPSAASRLRKAWVVRPFPVSATWGSKPSGRLFPISASASGRQAGLAVAVTVGSADQRVARSTLRPCASSSRPAPTRGHSATRPRRQHGPGAGSKRSPWAARPSDSWSPSLVPAPARSSSQGW
jgi:hypothetical protein